MNCVIAMIHPFIIDQDIKVYKNDECVETLKCKLDEVEQTCCFLCRKYNIHELNLDGNQFYAKHFKDKFIQHKFINNFDINVQIHCQGE